MAIFEITIILKNFKRQAIKYIPIFTHIIQKIHFKIESTITLIKINYLKFDFTLNLCSKKYSSMDLSEVKKMPERDENKSLILKDNDQIYSELLNQKTMKYLNLEVIIKNIN